MTRISDEVAERRREYAAIEKLVAEFFEGDAQKVALWLETPNPMLGSISPRMMLRCGRYERLLKFIIEAREAERATKDSAKFSKSG